MLQQGDMAPAFAVSDHEGNQVTLSDYRGKIVVLWFYPRADTPGWTIEANGFRDRIHEFAARNVQILGASTDTVTANAAFVKKFKFPYPLLCDTKRDLCLAYGACQAKDDTTAKRHSYVIGTDGTILQVYDTVKPAEHIEEVLAFLDQA